MSPRAYTRIAVAQIACQPAIALPGRAPFEDPLFDIARADARRPEGDAPPETRLYIPLPQALRTLLPQPDKVKAALEGSPGDDSALAEALSARGWTGGAPWDGERHRVPEAPPEGTSSPLP